MVNWMAQQIHFGIYCTNNRYSEKSGQSTKSNACLISRLLLIRPSAYFYPSRCSLIPLAWIVTVRLVTLSVGIRNPRIIICRIPTFDLTLKFSNYYRLPLLLLLGLTIPTKQDWIWLILLLLESYITLLLSCPFYISQTVVTSIISIVSLLYY